MNEMFRLFCYLVDVGLVGHSKKMPHLSMQQVRQSRAVPAGDSL
jgi:hypothetical protein